MNPNSPGHDSLESDIEMIDVREATSPPKLHQNGHIHPDPEWDDDDETLPNDDGSRGLLSGNAERTRFETKSVKKWPQVKSIVVESAPALLMTTVSLLFTGKLLDKVSHWRAMQEVDQLIMIIPVVLNLNGNLEMNLSARLGTAANIGELDDPTVRRSMIMGSLALLQVQTVSVSFIAACIALVLGRFVPHNGPENAPSLSNNSTTTVVRDLATFSLEHVVRDVEVGRKSGIPTLIMVAATTMAAAALSGVILGSFMCTLIVLCRKFDRDPDNIAPAVASCLGDLVTLVLVGFVSTLLIPFIRTPIPFIVACLVLGIAISCFIYVLKNERVRPLLKEGWSPLFGAMAISSGTGIVLDMFVSRYEGFAVLAIVISGLPGAAGSILVSRLSTALHAAKLALNNALPSYSTPHKHPEPSPLLTMVTLLLITLPVEVVFLSVLDGLGWLNLPILSLHR
ncbi:Solute carrier family 41 member 1 [Psilocybe cubensis]|uniref:Solute carrier family 41 member 1 n=1 Tax=Psilocybe cubensis TaxID=181762 RepID=A0ACB8H8T4_PSICU|nr:Solute carrier family 41 member 1 [Psilocybe cubensis]KAH9483604.1 Solute carrier family 41 member 1 [Psilocybe cubensis]